MRKEPLSEKKPALANLGLCPIQIANEAKIKKFIAGKACSGEKLKGLPGQLFGKEIRHVTHGSTQLSYQKSERDME